MLEWEKASNSSGCKGLLGACTAILAVDWSGGGATRSQFRMGFVALAVVDSVCVDEGEADGEGEAAAAEAAAAASALALAELIGVFDEVMGS
jgi:hypothetical protein